MELRQLRYFVAIVDSGSLSRAAARVHIVQPALSQQMTQLESELDVQLLQRSVKGVVPTEAGIALYRHAQHILNLTEETKNIVHARASEIYGRVKLGLPSSIAMMLVGPLIAELEVRYPHISLEIHESPSGYLAAQLLNEHVDLSILAGDSAIPGLDLTPLLDESLYFVQPRKTPLVRCGKTVSLHDLASVPLLLTTQATTLRRIVDHAFAEAGVAPIVKGEASSIQTMLALVTQGNTGTLVAGSALSWHGSSAWLQKTLVTPPIVRRASLAHSRLIPLSAASTYVRACVLEVVKKLVETGQWKGVTLVPASD